MKLPPLTALHYFSVVAKQGSFVGAARQLHVTESAVSRQMKLLTEYYNKALFEKRGRTLVLTHAGVKLAATASSAFESISQVSDQLLAEQSQLTIGVTTSFAIRWLLPRLADFEQKFPQYPVQMQATSSDVALLGKSFDVHISYYLLGKEPLVLKPHKLQDEWLLAVCSPSYLVEGNPYRVEQLSQRRLLLNEMTGRDWRLWGSMLAIEALPAAIDKGLKFEQDDVAIQTAVAGHGIALANLAYIKGEMALGSLVRATNQEAVVIGAHYLSVDKARANAKAVIAFVEWIRHQVTNDKQR
mgnify:CR=1 FL=1